MPPGLLAGSSFCQVTRMLAPHTPNDTMILEAGLPPRFGYDLPTARGVDRDRALPCGV